MLPKTWIDIHFGGEIPIIVTGEITNLEEDQIEITTYPEMKTIYIDFAYQGIPIHMPIEKILIRNKPEPLQNITSLIDVQERLNEDENITLESKLNNNKLIWNLHLKVSLL